MIKAGDKVIYLTQVDYEESESIPSLKIVDEVIVTEKSKYYKLAGINELVFEDDIEKILPEKKEPIFFTMSYDPKLIEELGNVVEKAMKEHIEVIESSCCELQEYATNQHSYYTADGNEMLSTWKQKGKDVYDVHVFEKVSPSNWKQLS